MMARRSIRARLAAAFSLALLLLMVAAIAGLIWYSKYSAERDADRLLTETAKRTVIESQEPIRLSDLIAEEREDLRGSNLALSIVAENGRVIARTQRNAPDLETVNGRNWRVVALKLDSGRSVVVGMPWGETRTALRDHAITLVLLGAFVLIVASVGAWFLVGRALMPIPRLARQAKASSAESLAISLRPPSQDCEMVELVDTLNGLLTRITETAAAKGRFYSAASHELRTPLQALSGHLELALSRDRTKEEYRAAIEEAYSQAKRLISLARALLFLYTLDSNQSPAKEPVDLTSVLRRSLSHLQPLIDERGLRVDADIPDEAVVAAVPVHIDMLVRNLLENAVRYSSTHAIVSLKVIHQGEAMLVEIANDCDTPLQWRQEELFEPFSRLDSSRNAKTGGAGLGLAICKSIADANGWRLRIEANAGSVTASVLIDSKPTSEEQAARQ